MKNIGIILFSNDYSVISDEMDFSDRDIDYLRMCLSEPINHSIIVFGDLGLWDGRTYAVKIYSGKYGYSQLFYSSCDYSTWYVDRNFDLRYIGTHHDGTNHYLYRAVKDNLSDKQLENLFKLTGNKKLSRAQLNRYTTPIGKEILEMAGIYYENKKGKGFYYEKRNAESHK